MGFLNLDDDEARVLLLLLGVIAIIGIFALLDIDNFQNLIFSSVVYIFIIVISVLIFFAKDIFDRFAPHDFRLIGIDTKGWKFDLFVGALLGIVFAVVNYIEPAATIGVPSFQSIVGKVALIIGVAPFSESVLLLSIILPLLIAFLPIKNIYLRVFVAGILDGLIFGGLHFFAYGNVGANLISFYVAIGFGIIFAWMAYLTNSIAGPAVAHTIINIVIFTKQTLSIGTLTIVTAGMFSLPVLFALAAICIGLTCLIAYQKHPEWFNVQRGECNAI